MHKYERKDVEAHSTGIINLAEKHDEEFVFRQLVANYQDGKPRSREQALVDLGDALRDTLEATPGFDLAEEPSILQRKDGKWVMIAKLRAKNRYANKFIDQLRSSGKTFERTIQK